MNPTCGTQSFVLTSQPHWKPLGDQTDQTHRFSGKETGSQEQLSYGEVAFRSGYLGPGLARAAVEGICGSLPWLSLTEAMPP